MNKCFLMGKLADKPQLKYTASGSAMVSARIVTVSRYQDQTGQMKESKQYHSVKLWSKQAESFAAEFSMVDPVFIEGSLEHRSYQKQDGTTAYATDIKVSSYEWIKPEQKLTTLQFMEEVAKKDLPPVDFTTPEAKKAMADYKKNGITGPLKAMNQAPAGFWNNDVPIGAWDNEIVPSSTMTEEDVPF